MIICVMFLGLAAPASAAPAGRTARDIDDLLKTEGDQSFITEQPVSAEVEYPGGAEFHVGVEDRNKVESWQWVASDGYSVFTLTGSSASTDTLVIPSTTQDDPEMGYVCIIKLKSGEEIISEPASLVVTGKEQDKTVLYVGDYAVEPGQTLDLSKTGMGKGKVIFDKNGSDITFDRFRFDNSVMVYDRQLSPGFSLFLMRRHSEVLEYNLIFRGQCSILNTFYDPDYNAGGVALNSYFGTKGEANHPIVNIKGDGKLTITGGSNLIYTDGELDIHSDVRLRPYGEYFTDGITCHNLYIEKGVHVDLECHGTAVHTDGDFRAYEGSRLDIVSIPAHASVGPTVKDILFIMGSVYCDGADISIRGIGRPQWFLPYERYLMMLNGIALNGYGTISLSNTKVNIDLCTEKSDEMFSANFQGIVGTEVNNTLALENGSHVDIKINTPGSMGATGIALGGKVTLEGGSGIKLDVRGLDETFGMEAERELVIDESSVDSRVVSENGGKTYGVVSGSCVINNTSPRYRFRSYAEGGLAFAAATGEIFDDPIGFEEIDVPEAISIKDGNRVRKPAGYVFGTIGVPGYGSYIKAESIFDKNDTSVPAEEVLISRGGSGAVWYIIGAVVLLAAIAAVLLAVLKRKGSSGTGAASIRL